jgi:hypothetical protein
VRGEVPAKEEKHGGKSARSDGDPGREG